MKEDREHLRLASHGRVKLLEARVEELERRLDTLIQNLLDYTKGMLK